MLFDVPHASQVVEFCITHWQFSHQYAERNGIVDILPLTYLSLTARPQQFPRHALHRALAGDLKPATDEVESAFAQRR